VDKLLIERRKFLSLVGAAPLALVEFASIKHIFSFASADPAPANLTVLLDEPIGTINPRVYGQMTEHIGRVIYEGIWVGPNSKIPNVNGLRTDTMDALKRVKPSVVRWPGGCFADAYQWQDGVGPPQQRPLRHNHWWLRDEPNTFGTDEFLEFCRLLNAEPFLNANVGTGSTAEALNWLEYCNGTGNGTYAQMRARNGHPDPYGVRLWGIGNENWGCGGLFSPAEYAQRFRQYALYFKRMGLSSDTELVGVGSIEEGWNTKFLDAVGPGLPYLDLLSMHKYFRHGPSITFSDAQYTSLMLDLSEFERLIRNALAAIDEVEPRRTKYPVFGKMPRNKPISLAIDEWGVWHSDATIEDGFRENGTLRDAIFAASSLNLFHQYAQRVTMTNIAQVTNCLHSLVLTDGAQMTLTPTFYVYEMYRDHQGAQSLRTELSNTAQISDSQHSRPAISASASRSANSMLITVANQSLTDGAELRINIRGGRPASATATSLSGPNVRSQNTVAEPQTVVPKLVKVELGGGELVARVPAGSVQAIRIQLG
jgi:alpha-L-arabinofuranosidase